MNVDLKDNTLYLEGILRVILSKSDLESKTSMTQKNFMASGDRYIQTYTRKIPMEHGTTYRV